MMLDVTRWIEQGGVSVRIADGVERCVEVCPRHEEEGGTGLDGQARTGAGLVGWGIALFLADCDCAGKEEGGARGS